MCVFFIFKISFDVDQFLKGFIEFVTALLVFYACFFFFFWLWGMWDLNSPPGMEPTPPALEGKVLTLGLPRNSV